jgi:MFS family permease
MTRLPATVRGLALCQALLLTNNAMLTSINGLAGLVLAPDPRLATLPVTLYVLGGALASLPLSLAMQRHGRRFGFALGCVAAMAAALIAAYGIAAGSFLLLCLGTLLFGVYNASGQFFRFAATDIVAPELRPRALSFVLAGGLIGAFLGPALSRLTVDAGSTRFFATYLTLIALALLVLIVTRRLDLPLAASAAAGIPPQRARFSALARRPGFWLALIASSAGWATMNLLMTATPLAMQLCGYPFADAAFTLQWHMLGMYAPMLISGQLIERFGPMPMIALGALLIALCCAIALSGITVAHFVVALTVLGVGWALLFAGGSALLVTQYVPHEKGLAQGMHDALMFLSMTLSSASAGFLMARESWQLLQWTALPVMGAVLLALMLLARRSAAAISVARGA